LIRKKLRSLKRIAIPEIPEVSAGTNATVEGRFSAFPALQNRNYRYFFFGQSVSVIGTWMQIVAQGWLVLQLSNSAVYLGLVAAMATAPSLLFSLFGGVAVDRYDKRKILYATQIASMLFALTQGILTLSGVITIPMIAVLAFLMGTVNAVDAPARQAFVSSIVTRDQLASAIAMNSGIFNAARALGPALAGVLIALVGSGLAFVLNALSYLALIIGLTFINYSESEKTFESNPFHAIRDGIKYSFSHPLIRVLMVFTGVLSVFGWSYSTLLPLIARNLYHLKAQGLGYMYAATGLGSLLATFLVGAYSKKISPVVFIVGGNVVFAVSLILFSFTPALPLALGLLFFMGMGLLSQAATMNTVIQSVVKNEFRGRVMSLYVLMFLGMAPLGNFEVGLITEHLSFTFAFILNAILVLLVGIIVFVYRRRIRKAYRIYTRRDLNEVR
jgi:MFS family permease